MNKHDIDSVKKKIKDITFLCKYKYEEECSMTLLAVLVVAVAYLLK